MNVKDLTVKGDKVVAISIGEFFNKKTPPTLIDVRSPGEFSRAHIPGAINIPLFNNEERALVGTTYTQKSSEEAIQLGFKIVQPKLSYFIQKAREIAPNGKLAVHCWRGGMRSASIARFLSENGFDHVNTIVGGYKAFRNFALRFFENPFILNNIGGFTGSGKTEILKCLKNKGQQVIDLEELANHRGSAFGAIDLPTQPSVEHFENKLFFELLQFNREKPIWVEDESNYLGSVFIPMAFFRQLKIQKVYFLNIPLEQRVNHLVETYSHLNEQALAESISKISKRLGFNHAKEALQSLHDKDYQKVVSICLTYYDKLYRRGLNMRDSKYVVEIPLSTTNHCENATKIINVVNTTL